MSRTGQGFNMTDFEAFDKVSKHLLSQKEKSIQETIVGFRCAYRGDNGLKCAIGCLIPDELYHEDMESITVIDLVKGFPEIGELFRGVDINLLFELQSTHDDIDAESWEGVLSDIYAHYIPSTETR